MSSAESSAQIAHVRTRPFADASRAALADAVKAPAALLSASLALVLLAAFAHGGVGETSQARIEVALAALTALAAGSLLWRGTLRLAVPRLGAAAVAALVSFTVWSGISLLWSVDPNRTWLQLNREIAYVLILILGVACGASSRRAVGLAVRGYVVVALLVTVYALGQKLLPGLHLRGVFNLDQTGGLPRLQQPLGYWNALALLLSLAVPGALMIAAERTARPAWRLAGLVGLSLMLLAIGLTLSRGGLLALAIGLSACMVLSGSRLRTLMWLGASVLAAVPPLVFGLANHSLSAVGVSLGARESAGAILLAILAGSMCGLLLLTRRLQSLERRVRLGPEVQRRVVRLLLGALLALAVAGVAAVALSSRGIDGTVSHAWRSFTATRGSSVSDAHRLLSADSANRWVWWKEAAGAVSDRPLEGWGAGSFPVVHLLYRRDTLSVKQPHSVPLQWLAETGTVGTVLACAGLLGLLAVGLRAVRRRAAGPERQLMTALAGATLIYAVHFLYDWDWDIPAVTLPVMLFLGVLAGAAGAARSQSGAAAGTPGGNRPSGGGVGRPSGAAALAAATLLLFLFACSAVLPTLAAGYARSAILAAAGGSRTGAQRAARDASLASSLNPLSDAGVLALATLALRESQPAQARALLLSAVRRNPSDAQAWGTLTYVDFQLRQLAAARRAATRVLALDPMSMSVRSQAAGVQALSALRQSPAAGSATAAPLPGS